VTRPNATRTVAVDTPVRAAIFSSVSPAASRRAIRPARAAVSLIGPLGPVRARTIPAAKSRRHVHNVTPLTENAAATTKPPSGPSNRPAEGPIEHASAGSSGNAAWLTRPILPDYGFMVADATTASPADPSPAGQTGHLGLPCGFLLHPGDDASSRLKVATLGASTRFDPPQRTEP